jgi:hypothetical protein
MVGGEMSFFKPIELKAMSAKQILDYMNSFVGEQLCEKKYIRPRWSYTYINDYNELLQLEYERKNIAWFYDQSVESVYLLERKECYSKSIMEEISFKKKSENLDIWYLGGLEMIVEINTRNLPLGIYKMERNDEN